MRALLLAALSLPACAPAAAGPDPAPVCTASDIPTPEAPAWHDAGTLPLDASGTSGPLHVSVPAGARAVTVGPAAPPARR